MTTATIDPKLYTEIDRLRARLAELEQRRDALEGERRRVLADLSRSEVSRSSRLRWLEENDDNGHLGLRALPDAIASVREELAALEPLVPKESEVAKARAEAEAFVRQAATKTRQAERVRAKALTALAEVVVPGLLEYAETASESNAHGAEARQLGRAFNFELDGPPEDPVNPRAVQKYAEAVGALLAVILGSSRPHVPDAGLAATLEKTLAALEEGPESA